jgi:hypothetical protein
MKAIFSLIALATLATAQRTDYADRGECCGWCSRGQVRELTCLPGLSCQWGICRDGQSGGGGRGGSRYSSEGEYCGYSNGIAYECYQGLYCDDRNICRSNNGGGRGGDRTSRYGEFCGRDRNGDYFQCDFGLRCNIFNTRDNTGTCDYDNNGGGRGGGRSGDYCDNRQSYCQNGLYCRLDQWGRNGRCSYNDFSNDASKKTEQKADKKTEKVDKKASA